MTTRRGLSAELLHLECEIAAAARKHNAFLRELGLPALPPAPPCPLPALPPG